MKARVFAPALAAGLFVAGCVYVPLGSLPRFVTGANGQGELRLTPEIADGGYQTLATVKPYGKTDIALLRLSLLKLTPDTQAEVPVNDAAGIPIVIEIPAGRIDEPISFTRLNANTTYRIKARAYLDAGASTLISTQDASSQTDVPIAQEDRPTLAKLKIQLIDKAFDGQGSSSLDITSGSLIPAGNETMTQPTPGPN